LPIEYAEKIVLDHMDNVITFEFAALEYTAPLKNRFKYFLEGFDKGWINNGTSRTATFTNIDPGEYVFKVKASNSDGIWNEQESSIVLVILPPFWKTWWFISIIVILFVSTGPIIYYLRVTELKKEQLRQQEISQLLIESQESERKRIAQEMHDSLGQELLVIKNRAIMGLKTVGDETKEKRQLEQISDGATNILKLVRTISHNLPPPELDRLGLTETIRSMLGNIREVSGKTLHAEVDEIDGLINKENEINLIRILQ
jgi:signal transduction histidine kinase